MENIIKEQAIFYLRAKDLTSQVTNDKRNSLIYWNNKAFDFVESAVKVEYTSNDPYESVNDLILDVKTNGKMLIYSGHNNSSIFPAEDNLRFRAVHDFFHFILNEPFTYEGESNVYEYQKRWYSEDTWNILKSEIVYQTAFAVYYNKFPDQKLVLI